MSENDTCPLSALQLNESLRALAQFFEDFYQGDAAFKAKLRGILSEYFADMVGEVLRIAKERPE